MVVPRPSARKSLDRLDQRLLITVEREHIIGSLEGITTIRRVASDERVGMDIGAAYHEVGTKEYEQ